MIRRVSRETAIALCDFPDLNRRGLICEKLAPELAAPILEGLPADELTYILPRMSAHERYRLLPLVSPEVGQEVDSLLHYEDNRAGGIMTTEFVSLRGEMSVQEALEHIIRDAGDRETIYACGLMLARGRGAVGNFVGISIALVIRKFGGDPASSSAPFVASWSMSPAW